MKSYFESEQSRAEYVDLMGQGDTPAPELIDKYNAIADNENMGGIH
jgi:hypothetical protein